MTRISFWGDFAPCFRYEELITNSRIQVLSKLRDVIGEHDFSIVNLESPLCQAGIKIIKSGPHLRADPRCIIAIQDAGFRAVSLANNHIMDFGSDGLYETINSVERAGLLRVGAGPDLTEAQKPLICRVDGLTIGVISVAEHEFSIATTNSPGAAPLDLIDNLTQINSIRDLVDLVFITMHAGVEFFPLPRPGLRKICRFFVQSGADAVICHHPHVVGAYEIYDDKPIVYSLGNLIFDHSSPPSGWDEGYGIVLEYNAIDKTLSSVMTIPYTQSPLIGGVVPLDDNSTSLFNKKIHELNAILADEDRYQEAWLNHINKQASEYLLQLYSPTHVRGMGRLARAFPRWPLLLDTHNVMNKLNLIKPGRVGMYSCPPCDIGISQVSVQPTDFRFPG